MNIHVIVEEYKVHFRLVFGLCYFYSFQEASLEQKTFKTQKPKKSQVLEFFTFFFYFRLKCISLKIFQYHVSTGNCTVKSQYTMKVLLWIRHRVSLPQPSHNEPENTVLV